MDAVLPAAASAVIVASLILGVALIATAQTMRDRQQRELVFLVGLAFVAFAVLTTTVQAFFSGGLS